MSCKVKETCHQGQVLYDSFRMRYLENLETECRMVVARGWEEWDLLNGYRVAVGGVKESSG